MVFLDLHPIPKSYTPLQRETMERCLDEHKILLSDDVVIRPHYEFSDDGFTHMHIKDMIPMVHVGPEGCGLIALFYDHWPDDNEVINANHAKLLDNHNPHPEQPFVCDTCKLPITDGSHIKPVDPKDFDFG